MSKKIVKMVISLSIEVDSDWDKQDYLEYYRALEINGWQEGASWHDSKMKVIEEVEIDVDV